MAYFSIVSAYFSISKALLLLNLAILMNQAINNNSSLDSSGGRYTKNLILEYPESAEKWVQGKSNKAFLHFFQL